MTTQPSSSSTRIVILGAGFGGLSTTLELCALQQKHPNHKLDITLIDRNDFQLFTPDLYEIASAAKSITNTQELKDAVCVSVAEALAPHDVHFVKAQVQSIDATQKQVVTSAKTLEYDYLVVALGSEPFYFNIPGMKEHSVSLKWIEDAIHIHEGIHQLLQKQDTVHVLVCGAGPAGVEVSAELMKACQPQDSKKTFNITLVEGRDTILQMMNVKAQAAATKRLQHIGVGIRTNFFIAKAEKGKVTSKDGEEISGDMIIWAGGVKASSMLEQSNIPLTERGQIAVHKTLQAKENEYVFAVGDNAECAAGENTFAPQTAHEAVHEGPIAAQNILRHIQKQPLTEYISHDEGMVVTLGGKHGVVQLPNGWVLKGSIGWFARKFVDFRHFRSVLPFMQACSVWYNGLKTGLKND